MSLDLSFHNITTLKAEAKIERRSQFVDIQIIPASGATTEITIHFDSKAKAQRFATAINYAAKCEAQAAAFLVSHDLAGASNAVEAEMARLNRIWRESDKPHRPSHPDGFAIEDEYQRDYDEERQHGWAVGE